jgi:dienelactone hydrolase
MLLMCCLAAAYRSAIADAPQPPLRVLHTPRGTRFGLFGRRPPAPAPTLFVLGGSVESMDEIRLYSETGRQLSTQGWLYITVDIPCHGHDIRENEPGQLSGWAHRVKRGEDFVTPFVGRCGDVLDYLIEAGYTDPQRVAACGTSRGGFCALRLAAAERRVRAVSCVSPVTNLLALSEFDDVTTKQAAPHSILAFTDKLAGRAVWLSMGNDDARVNTDDCIAVARSLVAESRRRHPELKTVPVEMIVGPSEGHRAIDDAYSLAARFIAKHVPRPTKEAEQPRVALPRDPVDFHVKLNVVKQELNPGFCWFHPRVAAVPGMGKNGHPRVVLTIQKHLVADDHYSGLYYMTSDDLGATWTGPTLPKTLDWQKGENEETIAVCDVTPGWHANTRRVIAIGIKLRYSAAGAQLMDKPRSYDCAYTVYDPVADAWTAWKMLDMPLGDDQRFYQLAPGCGQWLVKEDGTLLVPVYYQGPQGGPYSATVVQASFDGTTLAYMAHGDELHLQDVRGFAEPSLAFFQGKYYLTLRNDLRGYVTVSDNGLKFAPVKPWTFDNGSELGSYNTQQHWVTHSDGLFLSYTRRGANNDHITRNRAPLFMARVNPATLQVIRQTEQELMPERGVMLGNFGAAAVTENESWVTDSEFIVEGKAHPRGANGTTFAAQINWSKPNRMVMKPVAE